MNKTPLNDDTFNDNKEEDEYENDKEIQEPILPTPHIEQYMNPLITPQTNKSRPIIYQSTPTEFKQTQISPPHVNQYMEIPKMNTHHPTLINFPPKQREVIDLIESDDNDIDDNHNHNHNHYRDEIPEIPQETVQFDVAEETQRYNDAVNGTYNTVHGEQVIPATNGVSQNEVFFVFELFSNFFSDSICIINLLDVLSEIDMHSKYSKESDWDHFKT